MRDGILRFTFSATPADLLMVWGIIFIAGLSVSTLLWNILFFSTHVFLNVIFSTSKCMREGQPWIYNKRSSKRGTIAQQGGLRYILQKQYTNTYISHERLRRILKRHKWISRLFCSNWPFHHNVVQEASSRTISHVTLTSENEEKPQKGKI